MGDVEEGEFLVTLFQGKYRVRDLEGEANFPANSVQKTLDTVRVLFDPLREVTLNERIAPLIQEVRSLIRDGYVPTVRVVLCNNGAPVGGRGRPLDRASDARLRRPVAVHPLQPRCSRWRP